MAVLGRLLISSAERLDLPDLLSLDSYAAGDWKYFLKGLVGDSKPYILKGFDVIDPSNAIGTQSCSIRVADSVTFYPGSNAGAFFHGLSEGHAQAAPLIPELRKNAVNYVYLTFTTFNTSVDTRAMWDPDKDGGAGGEFTQDVNTESVLQVEVNVSTGSFPANTIPIAKITVGPVVITSIEDARDMMFRLGSGGIAPNPFNTYSWRSLPGSSYQRAEPTTQMLAGGVNPFQGADKNILTLKEWMDAIMSKLRELGGTTYWYDDTSSFGLINNFFDSVGTTFKSKGQWVHDTSISGKLIWSDDIQIKMTADPRTYIIRQGNATLANEQVMYVPMVRNQLLNATDESVSWINGQSYVNTIGGAVGLFANLAKGDYVKKANDSFDKWLRVEAFYDAVNLGGSTTTAANARSIRLSSTYLGTTGPEKGRYDKGAYLSSEVVISNRNNTAITGTGGNFHWLAMRSDTIQSSSSLVSHTLSLAISEHDGSTAKVTSVSHGLVDGDRITISGTTSYNGTHKVEVETSDIFYISISGGSFTDQSGSGYFATITTSARSTVYGFQEESANHGFANDDRIIIASTTNYNGAYQINVLSPTTFTVPISAAFAAETSGTATLARLIVRNEGTGLNLIQGQVIDIGGNIADNMRQYLGMGSFSETSPNYSISTGYNTLDGMQNWNSVVNEDLTSRVSKLTAMMADKAQDKTIKYSLSADVTTISNTTSGSAQQITFNPSGGVLNIVTPGSSGSAVISLPNIAPGISLLTNQVAYVSIDRNNTSTPNIFTSNISSLPIDENIFVVATRLSTTDVYLWDGTILVLGSQPSPSYLATVVEQNVNKKLIEGGTWSCSASGTLSWNSDAYVQIPGLSNARNTVSAGSLSLADGEVAYVDINRTTGSTTALTPVVVAVNSYSNQTNRIVIVRKESGNYIIGDSMQLIAGESKRLYAASSNQTLSALGLSSVVDKGPLRILEQIGTASKRIIITPIDTVVNDGTIWGNEISGLRMKFAGIQVDMQTGQYYAYGDGTLAGSGALIGTAFTPTSFTSPNVYRWYSVNFVADTLASDGAMNVKPLILPGTDGSSSATAIKAPFSGKKIGQVLVQATGTGAVINNITQSNVVQLSSGAGSGGSGAAPKLIGGGTFSVSNGGSSVQLSFTSDIYVEQPRLNYTDNTISTSVSPIILPTINHVAYIDRLNASSGGANLTVLIDLITNVKDGQVIIARRDGTDIIVGSSSTRLSVGESKKLYSGSSDQTLTYTGQPNSADSTPTYTNVTNSLATYPVSQNNDLTLAIGQTVGNVNNILTLLDQPAYDESIDIASGPTSLTPVGVNDEAYSYSIGNNTTIGQSFTPNFNTNLTSIVASAFNSGDPIFSVRMRIWSSSNGVPISLLYTAVNTLDATDFTSYIPYTYSFDFTNAPLTGGVEYMYVLDAVNAFQIGTANSVLFSMDGGFYSSGFYNVDGDVSTAPSERFYFEAYGSDANELIGPISSGTNITIPLNSRLTGTPQQYYTVGKGALEVFLNGQYLEFGATNGWTEVGSPLTLSSQITINQQLQVRDVLTFRISGNGGSGSSNLLNIRNISTSSVLIGNDDVVIANTTSGEVTITLPNANSISGKRYLIKKSSNSSNDLLINTVGGNLIDTATSFSFNDNGLTGVGSLTIVADGLNHWWIF